MDAIRQQQTAWQLSLFGEGPRTESPGATSNGGTKADVREAPKAPPAWERRRALTQNLMEEVADPDNLNQALKKVKANKGAPGIDGMTVTELESWLEANQDQLMESLISGSYRPSPAGRVEIPKPGGGKRQLGIPTVVDRLVQQALLQVLTPVLDSLFSESSFGFRPGRSAHDALRQASKLELPHFRGHTVKQHLTSYLPPVWLQTPPG